MPTLPNPFEFTGCAGRAPVDKAVVPVTPVHGATADPFPRGFDPAKFMADIEPIRAAIARH